MTKLFKFLSCITASFTLGITSCMIPTNKESTNNNTFDKSLIQKANFKTKAVEPQLLHFTSKVPNQNFSTTQDLPSGTFNEFTFKVTGNMRNAIRMASNSAFNLIIQSGSTFQIIDNDATDGTAIIQIPQGFSEGFATVTRDASGKQTGNINIKDELYYVNQDLKELEPSNKGGANNLTGDYWYQLKKRAFPLTSNWSNPNGENHVLKFTNNGIKQLLFRWYNTNTVDYPIGVNEIGFNGGIVELPNVGRLEIPQGALNQNTIISMREELEAYEILYPDSDPFASGERADDFVSPIVKIEPNGLLLNKEGKIYLETYKERVGNNVPSIVSWKSSNNKIEWRSLDFEPTGNYTLDSFAPISEFIYFSKQIPSFVKPDDNYRVLEDIPYNQNNFRIQAEYNSSHFKITYPSSTYSTQDVINIVSPRLEKAYLYYNSITSRVPYKWPIHNEKIPVTINKEWNNRAITISESLKNNKSKNKSKIILGKKAFGIEHELWHVFQYDKYDNDIVDKNLWIKESSATDMGARTFKKYYDTDPLDDKRGYLIFFNLSLNQLSSLKPLIPNEPVELDYDGKKVDVQKYSRVSFFTFFVSEFGDSEILDVVKGTPEDLHLDSYHDYSKYAYTGEKFDVYTDSNTKITTNNVNFTINNGVNNPATQTKTLLNNSTAYYKFSSNDEKTKGEKVSVRIYTPKTSCQSTGKFKILTYKNSSDIKTPVQEIDITSWREIGNTDNSKGWVELTGKFKEDYDYFVVINSNSDGKIENTDNNKCDYTVDVAIKIPQWKVKISYSDDTSILYINGNKILSKLSGGDEIYNINSYLIKGNNEIKFELYNHCSFCGGGKSPYIARYTVYKDDELFWTDFTSGEAPDTGNGINGWNLVYTGITNIEF
ncbi:MAG: hypothetical protein U0354_12245 [Candidatus Sericytochromatia bacterium]